MHVHAACVGKRGQRVRLRRDTAEDACSVHRATEARRAQPSPTSVVFFLGTQEEILFFRLESMKIIFTNHPNNLFQRNGYKFSGR
jgi:hypothetical protein